jgi:hypothetical protein
VRDNLFVELKCENNAIVIGYLDIQTRQWSILDFSLELCRYLISINWFEEGNLIVRTDQYLENSTKHDFYKIPFG